MNRVIYLIAAGILSLCNGVCFAQSVVDSLVLIPSDSLPGQFVIINHSVPGEIVINNTPGAIPGGGHIQGIQKLLINKKEAFILSGNSSTFSYYAIAYAGSQGYQVKYVRTILPLPYNHAGGIQVCDSLLAIGVEDTRKLTSSKVMIYDISNPGVSDNLPIAVIERKGAYKIATAGAVGLTKTSKGYLLAVGDWNSEKIDFYRSNNKQPHETGFQFDTLVSCDMKVFFKKGYPRKKWGNYQAIQLFTDSAGHIFRAATFRRGRKNIMDIEEVKIYEKDSSIVQAEVTDGGGPIFGKVGRKIIASFTQISRTMFHCSRRVSFRFGGGIYWNGNEAEVMATQRKPFRKIRVNVFK